MTMTKGVSHKQEFFESPIFSRQNLPKPKFPIPRVKLRVGNVQGNQGLSAERGQKRAIMAVMASMSLR